MFDCVTSLDDTRATYDAVAEPYAERFAAELAEKPLDRALLAAFAEQAGDGEVADLGCGPGHVTRHLRDLGVRARGVDLSPKMIEIARRNHPGIEFQVGSILGLDAADATWTGVLSFYSIIHLPRADVPGALREFHRVLRQGGLLLLAFHAGDEQVHVDNWFDRPVSVDGYFFDPDDIAAELESIGFTIDARVRRRNYPGVEIPTERAYLLARK
jgi:SAM-dependent methyltransferase